MEKYNQNTRNIHQQINLTQEDFFNTQEPKFAPVLTKQDRSYKNHQQQQPKAKSQTRKRDVSHDIFGFQPQQQKPVGKQLNRDLVQENFDGDQNFLTPKSPLNLSQNQDNISQKSFHSKRSQRSRKSFRDNNPLLKPLSQIANRSVSNLSQKSNMSRRDRFIEQLTSDPYQLKAQIKSLDKEIIHLKHNIENFNEMGNTNHKNPTQNKQDQDLLKINRLEVELINEKVTNKKLLKKKQKLEKYEREQIQSYENYMKSMKDKFQNNIEKNKDTMTAELSFKYNNNDEEIIKYLQRLIKSFQKDKKILGIPLKRPFLVIFLSINNVINSETYECQKFDDELPSSFSIEKSGDEYQLADDCQDDRIYQSGIPCEEIFYKGENQHEGTLYTYIAINPDKFSTYNQKKAEEIFIDLRVYPKTTENFKGLISPKEIEDNCFQVNLNSGTMPFDKYNEFNFAGFSKRLYHHFFIMLPIENLQRKNLDAEDEDLDDEEEQGNTVKELTLDSVIITRFQDKDKSDYHLFKKLRTVMLFTQHFYQVLTDLIGVNNSACNYFSIPKDTNVPSSLYLRNNSFLQKLKKLIEDQNNTEGQEERRSKKKERKLHLVNRLNCNKFFMENPMIIPDVAITDFTLQIPIENYKPVLTEGQETNAESILYAFQQSDEYFKNFHDEALVSYVSISSHTEPEMLFMSSTMDRYQSDAFFKAIKNKNASAETSEHKYFYFLSEFYKLFNEMIDRYIIEGVTFYHCFKQQNKILLNNRCPVFLKILKNVMEYHKINVLHFLDLDVNYIYQNPKQIAFELETFMHMTIKMADFYITKMEGEDFNGFDVESFGTDYNRVASINMELEKELKEDNFYEELVQKHNDRYHNKKQNLIEQLMTYFKGAISKLNEQVRENPDQQEEVSNSLSLIRACYYHLKEKIGGVHSQNVSSFTGNPQGIFQLQNDMEKFLEEEEQDDDQKDKVFEKVIELAKEIIKKNEEKKEDKDLII